jgi:hypothetical protein
VRLKAAFSLGPGGCWCHHLSHLELPLPLLSVGKSTSKYSFEQRGLKPSQKSNWNLQNGNLAGPFQCADPPFEHRPEQEIPISSDIVGYCNREFIEHNLNNFPIRKYQMMTMLVGQQRKNHSLENYTFQLMLLENQNKRRLEMVRKEQDQVCSLHSSSKSSWVYPDDSGASPPSIKPSPIFFRARSSPWLKIYSAISRIIQAIIVSIIQHTLHQHSSLDFHATPTKYRERSRRSLNTFKPWKTGA